MRQSVVAVSLAALALVAAACGPQVPPLPTDTTVRRNVSVQEVKAEPREVTIRLPVTLMPREEIELRAASAGLITELPYEQGDIVPAAPMPESGWIEADEYIKQQAEPPGEEQLLGRNLAHLDGLKPFARIDDRAARVGFRDAQAQYDAATRNFNRLLSYKDSTEAQLDQARLQRTIALAAVERHRTTIRDCYLLNPRQGVLKKRLRRAGEYVNIGELIGIIAVLDPLVATFDVPETHRAALKVGDEIQVEVASVTDPATGRPASVSARLRLVDSVAHPQTHSFRVEADIDNADGRLPAGVFGTTRVVIYRNEACITVPLTALRLQGENISLFTLATGNKVKEVKGVKLGRMTQEWVEILGDSLKPGQKVISVGAALLADGDDVIVRPDPLAPQVDAKAGKAVAQ